jgi:formate-dependent nitrite reductase cytochrome c552 subunit
MKPIKNIAIPLLAWSCLPVSAALAFQCNVCHSKNPAMVRMHKAVQAKEIGCFDCHKMGEKLMGKGRPKDRESLLARRVSEPVCVGCHK